MSAPHDRAMGALLGLAVGDALGMPTQSLSRAAITERYGVVDRLLDGADDQPIAPKLPAGTVTDDTEQALLLARILLDHGGHVPARVFAGALEAWEQDMIRRGSLDLLGPSTRRALTRLADGEPPELAGRDGVTNGAAMRVAPVGIAHAGPRLLDAVVESAVVTHHTAPGIAAAAAVAAAVSAGVSGAGLPAALDAALDAARAGVEAELGPQRLQPGGADPLRGGLPRPGLGVLRRRGGGTVGGAACQEQGGHQQDGRPQQGRGRARARLHTETVGPRRSPREPGRRRAGRVSPGGAR